MKILAIDVGTGTQDILIYDDEKELLHTYIFPNKLKKLKMTSILTVK